MKTLINIRRSLPGEPGTHLLDFYFRVKQGKKSVPVRIFLTQIGGFTYESVAGDPEVMHHYPVGTRVGVYPTGYVRKAYT